MKDKKGFTLVEVVVSVALIMVVLFYLLRTVINISNKNSDLVTRQEYSVYENNLLSSFYDDTKDILNNTEISLPLSSAGEGIYTIEYNDIKNKNGEPTKLIIDPRPGYNRIIYDDVVYKLPDNVSLTQKDGKYYDFTVIKRENDQDDRYGMIATNIYVKLNDEDEVIKLLYQGMLKTYQVKFYKNEDNTLNDDDTRDFYTSIDVLEGTDLTTSQLPVEPINTDDSLLFDDWYLSRTGGNPIKLPDERTSNISSNISLYAHYERTGDVYYIEYDGNGASEVVMPVQTMPVGKSRRLKKNTFEIPYYTFTGWNTQADGNGTYYSDQQSVKDLAKKNKIITLYAQWDLSVYDVELNKQGGSGGTYTIYEKYGKGFYIDPFTNEMDKITSSNPISIPSKKSYTFGGYYTSSYCSGTKYIDKNGYLTSAADPTYFTEDGELYACWIDTYIPTPEPDPVIPDGAETYTIKYAANGGTGTMENTTCEVGNYCNLRYNTFVRSGYTFTGWNTQTNGKGTAYTNGQSVLDLASANKEKTLYAQWIANTTPSGGGTSTSTSIVKFDCNGGSNPPADQTAYYGQPFTLTSATCTRSGYTQDEWHRQSNGVKWRVSETTNWTWDIRDAVVTLVADWNANSTPTPTPTPTTSTYKVTFNCNGGSNPPATQIATYNQPFSLTSDTCIKTGYIQDDWHRASNGVKWTPENTKNVTWLVKEDVELVADWVESTATLTYSANGHGTVSTPSVTMRYSEETKALSAISASGYTFTGWCTKTSGGTCYSPGAVIKAKNVIPTATTLYANWKTSSASTQYCYKNIYYAGGVGSSGGVCKSSTATVSYGGRVYKMTGTMYSGSTCVYHDNDPFHSASNTGACCGFKSEKTYSTCY